MNWSELEQHFSAARLGCYRAACGGDEAAAAHAYVANMLVAEAMMPMLSVLEIALKNGIHRRLDMMYRRSDWWESWAGDLSFKWQLHEVSNAIAKLKRRMEAVTPDKIIAELAFGFGARCSTCSFRHCCGKNSAWFFRGARRHSDNGIPSRLRSTKFVT